MRLVTFKSKNNDERAGALINNDQSVVDLGQAFQARYGEISPLLTSVQTIADHCDEALALASDILKDPASEAVLKRSDVHLRAPIQPPAQMRDFSCFELHLEQSFAAARRMRTAREPDPEKAFAESDTTVDDLVLKTVRRQPIYYKANRFAVIGADDHVIWPAYSRMLDFELEWGCYIGRPGKDISKETAGDHILGYTIFNDISARDAQGREMGGQLGPAKGKDFDTANVMGPCLVTPDELGDPYDLDMSVRVNGKEFGRGNTGEMLWKFDDVIAHVSQSETLHPGEFLGSGTVGNGSGLERLEFLKPNDVIELEVAKIGILRTKVIKP
ncbi:MAG: fumarylacetoacetate hydrolase family protein [Acidimicrobiales bacterium]|nr:fumarylacetoacetate hydrolase family protein [Hyphomonadaceae bacterium]RZV41654.1 MAG: fumarylacetoacetate hydrolase family protein [Acidimicrobiales bacterium]